VLVFYTKCSWDEFIFHNILHFYIYHVIMIIHRPLVGDASGFLKNFLNFFKNIYFIQKTRIILWIITIYFPSAR
jgi:hypothetical protein